jgi:hypothetical protein
VADLPLDSSPIEIRLPLAAQFVITGEGKRWSKTQGLCYNHSFDD